MKQKNDWTDAVRDRMKGAQTTPPAGGWERLEKELGSTGGHSPVVVPWKRVAVWTAAAAAVLAVVFLAVPNNDAEDRTERQTADFRRLTAENDRNAGVQAFRSADDSAAPESSIDHQTDRLSDHQTDRLSDFRLRTFDESAAAVSSSEHSSEVSQSKKDSPHTEHSSELPETPELQNPPQTTPGNTEIRKYGNTEIRPEHWLTDAAQTSSGSRRGTNRRRLTLGIPGGGAGGGTTSVMPGALAFMNGNYYYSNRPMAAPATKAATFSSNPYATIGNYVFNHRPELSVGLSMTYEPIERLVLETGLVWTTLSSQVVTPANTREQRVQYLGLPLYAGWRFAGRGAFSLTLSAGTTVERCLGARLGSWRQDERPWQFAVGGQMTVGYDLGHHVSLAFQPGLSYHLTETRLTTSRTDHPWAPSLRLTLQYTL